jgi:MYND finger
MRRPTSGKAPSIIDAHNYSAMGNSISRACSRNIHQVASFNPMTIEVNKSETRFISNDAGNGLFATEDLEGGDFITRVKDPYVLIPRNSIIPTVCYGCLSEKTNLNRCAGCKIVKYCSKTCQKKSWADIHKLECKVFRKCKDEGRSILPTPVRGLVQTLLRHPSGVDPDPSWSHLKTHKEEFMTKEEIWQDIKLQAWAALQYVGLPVNMMDVATSILCAVSLQFPY